MPGVPDGVPDVPGVCKGHGSHSLTSLSQRLGIRDNLALDTWTQPWFLSTVCFRERNKRSCYCHQCSKLCLATSVTKAALSSTCLRLTGVESGVQLGMPC